MTLFKILSLAVLFVFFNCNTTKPALQQTVNTESEGPTAAFTKDTLLKTNTANLTAPLTSFDWYQSNYTNYELDTDLIKQLKPLMKDVKVQVFMGLWCGDSKRQTPRFYKILEALELPKEQLALVSVDHSKKTDEGLENGYDIIRVPTMIFYKNGKELNRIVEYPRESLEKDMLSILSEKPYKHSYAN